MNVSTSEPPTIHCQPNTDISHLSNRRQPFNRFCQGFCVADNFTVPEVHKALEPDIKKVEETPFLSFVDAVARIWNTQNPVVDSEYDDSVTFYRRDPTLVQSYHQGFDYSRKPDVSCTSKKNVARIYQATQSSDSSNSTATSMNTLHSLITNSPDALEWKNHFACVELKIHKNRLDFTKQVYDTEYIESLCIRKTRSTSVHQSRRNEQRRAMNPPQPRPGSATVKKVKNRSLSSQWG